MTFSGDALHIDGDNPLVCKNQLVADGLESHQGLFPCDQKPHHFIADAVEIDGCQVP